MMQKRALAFSVLLLISLPSPRTRTSRRHLPRLGKEKRGLKQKAPKKNKALALKKNKNSTSTSSSIHLLLPPQPLSSSISATQPGALRLPRPPLRGDAAGIRRAPAHLDNSVRRQPLVLHLGGAAARGVQQGRGRLEDCHGPRQAAAHALRVRVR